MVLGAMCRIGLCLLLIYVCWDIKAVFYAIWSPFMFLVGYNDPRKPTDDLLHGQRPSAQPLFAALRVTLTNVCALSSCPGCLICCLTGLLHDKPLQPAVVLLFLFHSPAAHHHKFWFCFLSFPASYYAACNSAREVGVLHHSL